MIKSLLFPPGNAAAPDSIQDNSDDDGVSCAPQLADTCFGDVQDDLRLIFDPSNNYAQTTNLTLLRDLCSAWNDSLSCTSDVIDEGCQESDGRLQFDHWNAALRKTFEFVCNDADLQLLKNVFHSIRCFNMSAFLHCIEKTAHLQSVQDLLATRLDPSECWYMQKVFSKCGEYVSYATCAMEVMEPVNRILDEFLQASDCNSPVQPKYLVDSSGSVKCVSMLFGSFLLVFISISSTFVMLQI